jgi:hypothetical protein
MQARSYDYYQQDSAQDMEVLPAALPATDDPLTQQIRKAVDGITAERTGIEVEEIELPRHEFREGSFIVKDGTRPIGNFRYWDRESFLDAQAKARICKAGCIRGTVEQREAK